MLSYKETKTSPNSTLNSKNIRIEYDYDKNKYYAFDETGNSYECNKYGQMFPKFIKDFTGFANYQQRILNKSIFPISHRIDMTLYRPQPKFFEGYSQFPRSKVSPFTNLKIKNKNNSNNSLINILKNKKIFSVPENKKLLSLKTNNGLGYMTATASSIQNKHIENLNKKKLIELIDKTVKKNKISLELNGKNKYNSAQIRAMKMFKKKLLDNNEHKICGRELKQPESIFIEKYKLNKAIIFDKPNRDIKNKTHLHINYSMNYNNVPKLYENNKLKDNNNKKDKKKDNIIIKFTHQYSDSIIKEKEVLIQTSIDNKMLKGYSKPNIKEKGIYKINKETLPFPTKIYDREDALLKKVNSLNAKMEEEKIKKDKFFLLKAREKNFEKEKFYLHHKTKSSGFY